MAPKHKRPRTGGARTVISQDKLQWKPVERPTQASFGALDQEGGVLELEEVEGVEVCYEELPGGGKKVVFKVRLFLRLFFSPSLMLQDGC